MKDEIQETLLEIYESHTCKEVNGEIIKNLLGTDNYEEILALPGFKENYVNIKENKAIIEKIESEYKDSVDQVRATLWTIYNKRDIEGVGCDKIFVNLLKRTLWKDWQNEEKKFFELRYEMITKWSDFFISYTNRNAAETNNDFKKLITHTRGNLPRLERRQRENFVAKLIAKYLRQNNLTVYFDADVIKCGDDIEDNVRGWCKRSFSFVQLVEHVTFHDPGHQDYNWCYEEYNTFKKELLQRRQWAGKLPGRLCFFTTSGKLEDLKPAQMPKKYHDWYENISNLLYLSLEGAKIKEVRLAISRVARDIIKDKIEFIEAAIESEIDSQEHIE